MMKEFIDRFANMEKIANETLAAQPGALVGVDSMPGSEHDAKVPAEAKKPNAEVTQGQPAGATTAEGAVNGGDAKPLNEGKLEVNQPLENPDKKPLISDDALTAKEASAKIDKIVGELLDAMKPQKQASAGTQDGQAQAQAQTQTQTQTATQDGGTQDAATKEAQCGGGAQTAAKPASTAATPAKKEEGKDGGGKGEEKKAAPQEIHLSDEMISKIAAATASFMAGRNAAEGAIKKAADQREKQAAEKARALAIIKEACVKAAQEAGLDPAAAAAAADNAMAAAGMDAGAAEAAAADAGAAAADAGTAGAGTAGADGAAAGVQIPEDVTKEELGSAIVDLVQNGQLDSDTAKALVDELAGDSGDAGAGGAGDGITEDQAAEIIANGLESGEITPEQATELVKAIEAGSAGADAGAAAADAGAAGADAGAAAEAAGAAAADAGAADAEAALKQAAADVRQNALNKVASAILAKRNKADAEKTAQAQAQAQAQTQAQTQAPVQTGSPLMNKVAAILTKHKEALDAKAAEAEKQAAAQTSAQKTLDEQYLAGFCKKASEMGVDPKSLAQYVIANKARFAQAK